MKKRKVILRRCEEYNPIRMREIIRDGIAELGEQPRGRILIKPNVVTANTEYIHHSYTAPPIVEAMVDVLRETSAGSQITIGESGAIGVPTRAFFADSGYARMARNIGIPLRNFNEEKTKEITLARAKWHKTFLAARSLHEADYKIWMPKLKYHIVCQITNALKLNIGILTHKERFLYHDDRLNEKVVDLLEFGWPNLIVTDAVMIGHGFESSPYPFHLGAILISNDPVAADVVAARILNYQPEEVAHLVEARERGYGSLDINDIEVTGDLSIDDLAAKTKDIESAFQDLQKLKTPIKFYEGVNPKTGNICYGGCICSIKGVLGTAEKKYPGNLAGAKAGAIVMGYYKGDVIHPGQPVALIGTCSDVEGRLECGRIIRIKSCPVKVRDLAVLLLRKFGMKSPAFDVTNISKMIFYSAMEASAKASRSFR
ncbi:MAG: DUF362 domain-containing protein [Candidatus Abyssobacteria bacterium SURF_5]|uniref:DUF362 domain-containing protein n=1 Tax=Abyssobacteria bacterium (strain SURF_5) TaxID=2093360 RepID=A0A3A4PEB2_ABYX5|nr:MAG: DUF362 domain-containing protein [Candidatus Abyssubacteria bacterium SURF_5]